MLSLRMSKTKTKFKAFEAPVDYHKISEKIHKHLSSELPKAKAAVEEAAQAIVRQERALKDKKAELDAYEKSFMGLWFWFLDWVSKKKASLRTEVAKLEGELVEMRTDEANKKHEVATLMQAMEEHLDDQKGLDALREMVDNLELQIKQLGNRKKDEITAKDNRINDLEAEHIAEVDVLETRKDKLEALIHGNRTILYRLTATCAQKDNFCKKCSNSRACGETCISKDKECHKPPGCACDVIDPNDEHQLHQDFALLKEGLEETISTYEATISDASRKLIQNGVNFNKLEQEKLTRDEEYENEKNKLVKEKAELETQKDAAQGFKKKAKETLAEKTVENADAVAALELVLKNAIDSLQGTHTDAKNEIKILKQAHSATLKKVLADHDAKMIQYDADISARATEKAGFLQECDDLGKALAKRETDLGIADTQTH